MKNDSAMRIEFYADVACPWCYIGLRRYHRAVEVRPRYTVNFLWRPFQLQPDLDPNGVPWQEFIPEKFGSHEHAKAMFEHVKNHAVHDAIDFGFEHIVKANNTRDAHRLLLWAQEEGQSYRLAEELFADYFTRGRDLNNLDVLADAAERIKLSGETARKLLTGDRYAQEVKDWQAQAARIGVSGVPFYVVDGRYGISGAQPLEVIVRTLDMAASESRKEL